MSHPGRISNIQGGMLAITSLTIMGHLIMLTLVIDKSRQDCRIAAIAGGALGTLGIWVLTKFAQRFPGLSLVEILFQRFSWPGKLVGVLYLIYFYMMAVLGVRLFAEAYKSIMIETPLLAFVSVITLLCAYIVFLGLEVLGRINQVLLPVLVVIGLTVAMLAMGNKDYSNLLPILGRGLEPVGLGAVAVMGWFCEFAIMGMVLPYVQHPQKILRVNLYAGLLTLLFFLGPVTGPVAMFGPVEAAKMVFPTFSEVRYMKIGELLNRLDSIAIIFWTVGLTIRISLFYFGLALGTAQAFRLKRHQPLVIPLAWLIGTGTVLFARNFQELKSFLYHVYVPLNLLMGALLPALLLLAARLLFRKKGPSPE